MSWQAEAIVELVRHRYPEWDGFAHVPFLDGETNHKRKIAERWQRELGQAEFAALLAAGQADELVERMIKLGRASQMLYNAVPQRGDMRLLFRPMLNSTEYASDLFALLYDDEPLDLRFARYCMALAQARLPNQWAWSTFGLLMTQQGMIVKPRPARWFLQFMGAAYERQPNPDTYADINRLAQQIKRDLAVYEPTDWIDIQSLIWIAYQESQQRTGRLNSRAQIELGHPPSTFDQPLSLAEPTAGYQVDQPMTLTDVATETAYSEAEVEQWMHALRRKGQLVFTARPARERRFWRKSSQLISLRKETVLATLSNSTPAMHMKILCRGFGRLRRVVR